MGATKIDIHKDEVQYKDVSFSSYEDIYNTLLKLDLIYNDFEDGNLYAGFIYNDLVQLMGKIDDAEYIKMYHDIQLGIIPMKIDDHEKKIEDVAAENLNITSYEYIQNLNVNIEKMVEVNYSLWIKSINKQFKNKLIKDSIDEKDILAHMNDVKLKEIDFIRKYVYSNERYHLDILPKDIEELYEYRDYIINKINEFEEMKGKYFKKDNVRFTYYKNKISQYTNIKIEVNKDISILKDHYFIPKGNQNNKGKKEFIRYNSNSSHIINAQAKTMYTSKLQQIELITSDIDVGKIKEIARKVLTNRQYIIFELYYLNGLTQQEIADIIEVSQPFIKKSLDKIINKIKESI